MFVFGVLEGDVYVRMRSVACVRPSGSILFDGIDFAVDGKRGMTLVKGGNSKGSALVQLVAGRLLPSRKRVVYPSVPCSVPRRFNRFGRLAMTKTLKVREGLCTLRTVLRNSTSVRRFATLTSS